MTPETTPLRPSDWSSDKWATPPELIAELEQQFGSFDLDPCCEPHTAKAPNFYTDNGLSKPWFGNVFVNPPYSDPRPWCERARDAVGSGEAKRVVMLLPVATDTRWFHEVVWPAARLQFIRGRVRFIGWQGTPIPSPRSPSMLAIFEERRALEGKPVWWCETHKQSGKRPNLSCVWAVAFGGKKRQADCRMVERLLVEGP